MTRVALLNDTSDWHCGSAAASTAVRRMIEAAGGKVALTLPSSTPLAEPQYDGIDAVVVNAEGSFHHDIEWAWRLLEWLSAAHERSIRTAVVNAMWCQMSSKAQDVLERCDLVVFRDPLSRAHAGLPDAPCYPDVSILEAPDVPVDASPTGGAGRCVDMVPKGDADEWRLWIARLSEFGWIKTFEHHACVAGAMAGIDVKPITAAVAPLHRGWKIEGLCAFSDNGDLGRGLRRQRPPMVDAYPKILADFLA